MRHWLTRLRTWAEAKRYAWHWEHGTVPNWDNARQVRRHRRTGEVQFVIWPAGHATTLRDGSLYVYAEDFWVRMDPYWWPGFTPSPQ